MTINVGDIVECQQDKNSCACFGFVSEIDNRYSIVKIKWFDGIESQEYIEDVLTKAKVLTNG
jgi:hypothetical protein